MSEFSHDIEVEIAGTFIRVTFDFDCSASYPASGPSYASGGEPGGGGEVEIDKATLHIPGTPSAPAVTMVEAPDWLMAIFHADDDLADTLREHADENRGPDPDEARDRERDDE